jgi:hypothetical protein
VLSELTHATFEPCVGQTFVVRGESADTLDLTLVAVTVVADPIPGVTSRHAFSLIFRGPADRRLDQALYHFENETAGALDFTIVPIGPDSEGLRYEAVFS